MSDEVSWARAERLIHYYDDPAEQGALQAPRPDLFAADHTPTPPDPRKSLSVDRGPSTRARSNNQQENE